MDREPIKKSSDSAKNYGSRKKMDHLQRPRLVNRQQREKISIYMRQAMTTCFSSKRRAQYFAKAYETLWGSLIMFTTSKCWWPKSCHHWISSPDQAIKPSPGCPFQISSKLALRFVCPLLLTVVRVTFQPPLVQ